LEGIDLEFLSKCTQLQKINLGGNKIQNLDTQSFKDLTQLKEFRLSNNLIKRVNLDGLQGCNRLEVLNLSNNHIHEIDLSFLNTCPNLTILNLQQNQLDRIEIDALENCKSIEVLDLSHNWIREIDLGPLTDSKHLRHLDLSQNPLNALDITPLMNCSALEHLTLDWTQLLELNLSPLSECHNLRKLGISHNRVDEIDLYPLVECSNLESLDISGINAMELDLWPLFSLPRLSELQVSRRTKLEIQCPPISVPWSKGLDGLQERVSYMDVKFVIGEVNLSGFIAQVSDIASKVGLLGQFYLRMSILDAFSLQHLRGFDGEIIQLLESFEDTNDFHLVQRNLRERLLFELETQLNDGGSTHFIDVEKSRIIPELAVLAPKVLELRRQEVESVQLYRHEGSIDLIPLWETSYGFEMLGALCLGLSTNDEGLNHIRSELSKLGIELENIIDSLTNHRESKLSEGLRLFILMRANQCS